MTEMHHMNHTEIKTNVLAIVLDSFWGLWSFSFYILQVLYNKMNVFI